MFVVSFTGEQDKDSLFRDCGIVSGWLPKEAAEGLKAGVPVRGKIDINGDFVMLRSVEVNGAEYKLLKDKPVEQTSGNPAE